MKAAILCVLLSSTLSNPAGLSQANAPQRAAPALMPAAVGRSRPPTAAQPAKGRFLIANRNLRDPNFAETVVLLLTYDAPGAMGVVINRPTDVRLASALPKMKELRDRPDRLFLGGPVAANAMLLLIRSASQPASAEHLFGDVYASGSLRALRKALRQTGKTNRLHAYAGYAGWAPGQLDQEIARGDWHVTAADAATIFDTPAAEVWPTLSARCSGEWTRNGDGRITVGYKYGRSLP